MRRLRLTLIATLTLAGGLWATGIQAQEAGNPAAPGAAEADLPLSQVVLFTSGVGYYQRDGQVDGDAQLELRFNVEDINDLLKSMVLQDYDGGQITSVTYASREPITRTLGTFAIDLTNNPTLAQILDQMRGERIEIMAPNAIEGTIVGIERQRRPVENDNGDVIEVEILNLLTDTGLRSIPLEQVQQIRFLSERIQREFNQALAVLAQGHDVRERSVVLEFSGEGARHVRVGYIQESPVWKTSYRLVLGEEEAPFLQGWALVENMSDEDWEDVNLTLVSGRPVSFIMDLYEPLYVPRPVVVPELFTSLVPRRYGGAMEEVEADMDMALQGGGFGGGRAGAAAPTAPGAATADGRYLARAEDEAFDRANAMAEQLALDAGIQSVAQATEVGELFRYVIDEPVSLPRRQSAMLPIVNQTVEGEKLSIYNSGVHAQYPLHGLRLTNTTGLHLMQGPITVFDEGVYAGDAQIEDIGPGDERLISYAMDLDVEVEPVSRTGQQTLLQVRLVRGTLIATHTYRQERTYNVRNRDDEPRTLLIEHPFDQQWTLVEPAEPEERTREVYRFRMEVPAGETASLLVREERRGDTSVALSNIDDNTILFYMRQQVVSEEVREALARVIEMKGALNQTVVARQQAEQRVQEIAQDQERIRENLQSIPENSELYGRYITRLTDQEDELDALRAEIERLQEQEQQHRQALDEYLLSLDLQ